MFYYDCIYLFFRKEPRRIHFLSIFCAPIIKHYRYREGGSRPNCRHFTNYMYVDKTLLWCRCLTPSQEDHHHLRHKKVLEALHNRFAKLLQKSEFSCHLVQKKTLFLKITIHENWRVYISGIALEPLENNSPSCVERLLKKSHHQILFFYGRKNIFKKKLRCFLKFLNFKIVNVFSN